MLKKTALLLTAFSAFALLADTDGRKLFVQTLNNRTNLAAGKLVEFTPAPSYRLTTDDKDGKDLTDGKLSRRADDRIWFDRNAVGWRTSNTITLKLDMGKKVAMDKVAIRIQGGAPRFAYPNELQSYVSNDGKLWYQTGTLTRLQPGEKEQHDAINFFYYDEATPAAPTVFLNLNAEARYVLIRVKPRGFFFTDEVAVLAAEKRDSKFNSALQTRGVEIPLSGFIATLRTGKLALSQEFFMPQFFEFTDLRADNQKKGKVELQLTLPKDVELENSKNIWQKKVLADGMVQYQRPLDTSNHHYRSINVMLRSRSANISAKGYINTSVNGKEQFKSTFSCQVLDFPKFKPFEKLHVSLAWIGEDNQRFWPDFFNTWRRLGFNTVSAFPLHRAGGYTPEVLSFFAKARQENMKLILNLSAVKELERSLPKSRLKEVACIGSKRPFIVCPSYFGEHWQAECQRLTNHVALLKPDYVFFDIESWGEADSRAVSCKRCSAGAKKANLEFQTFMLQCGKQHAADLKKAIEIGAKQANITMPEIGSYDRGPHKTIYQITRFTDEYPAYTDMAQPSLYVAGRVDKVREIVKKCASAMNYNKKLIPFLTAGTYGEYSSELLEPMILESFLNGAGGITYFKFADFDTPEDFYYHAVALAKLRPYEDLIAAGKPVAVSAAPAGIKTSALQDKNEILLLIGNYDGVNPQASVTLPAAAAQVVDGANGKTLPLKGKVLNINVPAGKFRLIYIKFAK